MIETKKIMELAKRKLDLDKKRDWSKGSKTYFDEIKKEIQEAEEENKKNNHAKLEDELGDIFWDYSNMLVNLEDEGKIRIKNVFLRAKRKYKERIIGIENNVPCVEIKKRQKESMQQEIKDNISTVQKREEQKKEYCTWECIRELIGQKLPEIKQKNYKNIYGIPRGGLVIATIISYKLSLPILMKKEDITNKTLIVDDICDSGKTLKEYKDKETFTIFYKKEAQIKPTYYSKIINQETWIVFPWEE